MKVAEIMTRDLETCDLNASMAEAAQKMWDRNCGILPVLKDGKEIVGVVTDRDICMGVSMRDCKPSAVSVEEVLAGPLYTVSPNDELEVVLETMRVHKVRRLPVVNAEGELEGLVSMNDVTLCAGDQDSKVSLGDVVNTYKAICEHPESTNESGRHMTATA
jgi:CBS domain-containing protein